MNPPTTIAGEQGSVTTGSQAFTQLRGWVTGVVSGLAAFSGAMYAMGYLVTYAQMRMLGAGMVDLSNQEILKRVLGMPLLSVFCIVFALFSTWRGFLLAVVMLLLYLRPGIGGLLRAPPVGSPEDADPPEETGATPAATNASRKARMLRRAVHWSLLGLVMIVSAWVFLVGAIVLSQDGVLLSQQTSQDGPVDGESSAGDEISSPVAEDQGESEETIPTENQFDKILTGYPDLSLDYLMREPFARRSLYGLLLLAVVFCLTVWLGLWFHFRAIAVMETPGHRLFHLLLIVAGLMIFVVMLNIPLLYGYLVVENEFSAIEIPWQPGWQAEAASGEESGPPAAAPGEIRTLLILGQSRGMTTVYSPDDKQLWNVPDEDLQQRSRQLPAQSPFD